jgi:hypothetical protein
VEWMIRAAPAGWYGAAFPGSVLFDNTAGLRSLDQCRAGLRVRHGSVGVDADHSRYRSHHIFLFHIFSSTDARAPALTRTACVGLTGDHGVRHPACNAGACGGSLHTCRYYHIQAPFHLAAAARLPFRFFSSGTHPVRKRRCISRMRRRLRPRAGLWFRLARPQPWARARGTAPPPA